MYAINPNSMHNIVESKGYKRLQEQPVQILIFDKIQIMNHIIDSVAIIDHTNKCGYTALHLFCKTNSTQDFE